MGRLVFMILANIACMTHQHLVKGQGFTTCTYSSNCTATTNLGIIDLNGASKGSPYQCTNPATSNNYFWEPCTDFTFAGVTAGAMLQETGAYTTSIGVHRLASCDTTTDGDVRFNMKTDNYWFTWVKCICGGGDTLTFESENPVANINLIFTSHACCTNYSPTASATISPGTVVVIIFFSVIVVYLIFGAIYQSAVRKAQGRERIPNVALWSTVPGLIKDGFIFTFTCGRRSGYGSV